MTDPEADADSEVSIEFDLLERELESGEYPATTSELRAAYGEYIIEHSQGELTFREVLESFDEDEEFESATAVRQAIFAMVRSEIIGREQYSNRSADEALDEDEESREG